MSFENIKVNFTAKMNDFNRSTKSAKTAMDGLGTSAKYSTKNFGSFYKSVHKANMGVTNFTKDANRANSSILKMGKGLGGLNQLIGVSKLFLIGQAIGSAVTSATEMIETTNLFSVAMGEMATETERFVDATSQSYGFDKTNIMSAVGTYNLLARSMGMSADNAKVLSENTYKLAGDLSSLTNVPINQVLGDLRSGLVGQSETVYKYGLDITEASIKQEAYLQGITKSVRNMSQGEKMGLRYSAMIRQSSLAHGDFARTINTPANQLKILGERFISLTRSIGSMFIPILAKILPYLNAVVGLIKELVDALALIFGYEPPEVTDGIGNQAGYMSDEVDALGDSADSTAKKLKKMKDIRLGFDELNVISEPDSASGGGAGGAGAMVGGMDFDLKGYDNLMDSIIQDSDRITGEIKGAWQSLIDFFSNTFGPSFNTVGNMMGGVLDRIKTGFNYMYFDILTMGIPFEKWLKTDLVNTLNLLLVESGRIFTGILDTVSTVFFDLWNVLIEPVLSTFVNDGLPVLTRFADEFILTFSTIFTELKTILDTVWEEAFKPVFKFIGDVLSDLIQILAKFWNEYGSPIFSKFRETVVLLGGVFMNIWNSALKPVFDAIMRNVEWLWTGYLAPLLENILNFAGVFIDSFLSIVNEAIIPLVNKIVDFLAPIFASKFEFIVNIMGWVLTSITGTIDAIITVFTGIIQFITGVLTGDWEKAWEGIATIFQGIFEGIGNTVKSIFNGIIIVFEFTINRIIDGINWVINKINSVIDEYNELELFPNINWSMNNVPAVNLPRLARGGSLQPGQLFEAGEFGKAEAIGSYQGKTTVMPLENTDFVNAIYNAVKSAMSESEGNQIVESVVVLDGEQIYRNQQKVAKNRGFDFGMGAFSR